MNFLSIRSDSNLMLLGTHAFLKKLFDSSYLVQKQGTNGQLVNIKKKYHSQMSENGENNINLVIALLNEPKCDIKAAIIELLCVFLETLNWMYSSTSTKQSEIVNLENDLNKSKQNLEIKASSESLLFIFTMEMYLTKPSFLGILFESLSQTCNKTLIGNAHRSLIINMVDYLILPIIASAFHLNYDFLPEFERFFVTIFDAGFSEYFLSRIQFIKEILITNLTCMSNQKKLGANSLAKVKFYLTVIDKILGASFMDMLDTIPFICNFYINNILKLEEYSSLNHYVPGLFAKLLYIQRQVILPDRSLPWNRSFCTADIRVKRLSKESPLIESKCDMVSICGRSSVKQAYLELDDIIKWMYSELFEYSSSQDLSDSYENAFIGAFTRISSRLIYYINLELQREKHLDIEDCLMTILNKVKNKKNKLLLIDYILSNQHMLMWEVRKKMWQYLFTLFNDKALAVEIVFTNYNIIYGLKNFSQLINERFIVKIFYQTVSSMRSKNRKLINNCLKIFGYTLGYYSHSIIEWIVDMEVPNVFYDEMEGDNKKETIPSLDFLAFVFKKFILHKYSKFNLIAMSSIAKIETRHEAKRETISRQLMEMVESLTVSIYQKLLSAESYKMKYLALVFLLKERVLVRLSTEQILGLTSLILSLMSPKDSSVLTKLRKEPEERDESTTDADKDTKLQLDNESISFLLRVHFHICTLEDKALKTSFFYLVVELSQVLILRFSGCFLKQPTEDSQETTHGADCAIGDSNPKYICSDAPKGLFPGVKSMMKEAIGILPEEVIKRLPPNTLSGLENFVLD